MRGQARLPPSGKGRSVGLTSHVWEIEELVGLMEPKSILDGLGMAG